MEQDTYQLRPGDEMVVIDASELGQTDGPGQPAYTLLIEMVDGRWLVYNATTHKPSEAAWLMRRTRREGVIGLDDWTDITTLRKTASLDWSKALGIGYGTEVGDSLRPACPDAPELSQLLPGDSAHVMRSSPPGDPERVWWIVMVHLVEGVWLQYLVPFEKPFEAEDLLRQMALTNAFVTEDFNDVTEEMEAIDVDRSGEIEIDGSGSRRVLQ